MQTIGEPRAPARRARPLLRRDREPAQDPRRAADPARRRAARLPGRRPRAHARGARGGRGRGRRRRPAAARRLRLRDAPRPRAPAQRDDAAAAADARRLRAAPESTPGSGRPAPRPRADPCPGRGRHLRGRAPRRVASPTTTSAPATRSSSPPSRSTGCPVTNGAYAGFLAETGAEPPLYWRARRRRRLAAHGDGRPTADRPRRPGHPRLLGRGRRLARWAGKRLPTEEEWEAASPQLEGVGQVWEWTVLGLPRPTPASRPSPTPSTPRSSSATATRSCAAAPGRRTAA